MSEEMKPNPSEDLAARVTALEAKLAENPRQRKPDHNKPPAPCDPKLKGETIERLHEVFEETEDRGLGRLLDKYCDGEDCRRTHE